MERKILQELLKWKESSDRMPMLLMGARQVGKTWAMREFGRRYYKSVAYVNCELEPLSQSMFEQDYDIDRILNVVQAITKVKVEAGDTLLIFDEIQEVRRGLQALKYFCENAPEIHVMAAGSLLGITLRQGESFPVGKTDMLYVYPMDFEEFMIAAGKENLCKLLEQRDWSTIGILRTKYIDLLRQYYYVGGMPGVVSKYFDNQDFSEVRRLQNHIIDSYRKDITKHTTSNVAMRIGMVLNSVPSQLAKENRKFVFGAVKKGARAADFELAIQWLEDAGVVHRVNRVSVMRQPLKFYEDMNAFKLYLLDCGLFGAMSNVSAAQIIASDNAFVEFKGAFTEQFVLQQLISQGLTPYYWTKDNSTAEIDFVVEGDTGAYPVEVKAEENVRARSLMTYLKDNPDAHGIRLSMKGYVQQDRLTNYPLYATSVMVRDIG